MELTLTLQIYRVVQTLHYVLKCFKKLKCRAVTVFKSPFTRWSPPCSDPDKVDTIHRRMDVTTQKIATSYRSSGANADVTPCPRNPEIIEKGLAQGVVIRMHTLCPLNAGSQGRSGVSPAAYYNVIRCNTGDIVLTGKRNVYIIICPRSESQVRSPGSNKTVCGKAVPDVVIRCGSAYVGCR